MPKGKVERNKWTEISMQKTVKAVRKKECGYKIASKQFNVPLTTLKNYVAYTAQMMNFSYVEDNSEEFEINDYFTGYRSMAKILTEYILLTLLVEETVLVIHIPSSCEIVNVKGLMIADCSSKGLLNVPTDLDPNIEGLDMGSCSYTSINEWTFKNYTKLKWLKLTYMMRKKDSKFDPNTFANMDELEYLDISGSLNYNDQDFIFPPNLQILRLSDNYFKFLDLTNLTRLEQLVANNNDMEKFPFLNSNAPLTNLELKDDPLYDLSVEQLAPFCNLRSAYFKINDRNGIRNPERFCDCILLEQWLIKWNISFQRLNCTSPGEGTMCDLQFQDRILQLRRQCVARVAQETTKFGWLFISLIIILMGLVMALSILYTRSAVKSRRERLDRNTTNDRRERKHQETHEETDHSAEEEHEPEILEEDEEEYHQ